MNLWDKLRELNIRLDKASNEITDVQNEIADIMNTRREKLEEIQTND